MAQRWAIIPTDLEQMAEIATREHEFSGRIEALEAKRGKPLDNTRTATVRDRIAIIPAAGPMFKRASFFAAVSGATDYAAIARDFTAAAENSDVDGILLSIDSPGGQVDGLSDLAAMFKASNKPVWVHTDGTLASAAYWMATGAAKIYASDTANIGSIGCVYGVREVAAKDGEKTYKFVSSQSPAKHLDPGSKEGAASLQASVNDMAAVFIDTVASNRGVSSETVLSTFGRGDVMIASKAVAAGIIDGVATFEATFSNFKKEISGMNYQEITAGALAEKRPDLVTAIADKAKAEALAGVPKVDAEAIRTETLKAERDRIIAIDALAIAGAETVIAACKADGSDANATAVKVLQHMKAQGADSNATALANIKKTEVEAAQAGAAKTGEEGGQADKDAADVQALVKAGVFQAKK